MKDFIYYRCSGSDGYRFGGEAICRNRQVQGKFLETIVWGQVCELLRNPRRLEQKHEGRGSADAALERVENLKTQRLKVEHAVERLIDGFTEGLIEKEQFTLRMDKTKKRIADLEVRIKEDAGDVGHVQSLRLAMKRLHELSAVVGPNLADADWHRRREIIRTLVQKIEPRGHQGRFSLNPECSRLSLRFDKNALKIKARLWFYALIGREALISSATLQHCPWR